MKTTNEIFDLLSQTFADVTFDRQPESLYAPIKYALSLGGKRLRPALLLMAYNLYRDDLQTAMPAALALEFYHNFTLMHDDVMDRADIRRGKPTVHKVWNDNAAILSGDTMLLMAFRLMASVPPQHLKAVMDLFIETTMQIDEGQQLDIDFESRMDVTEEEYIEMIRLKTSVLMACAMKIGAMLADAPAEEADALYDFGLNLGLSFQLQDDLLDVYGDPETFGKKIGGDILCNKKTYMLIQALSLSDPLRSTELKGWLTRTLYDPREKIRAVTDIYNRCGVRQLAEQKINEYFDTAMSQLQALGLPEERKQVLADVAFKMLKRQR
ncbi:MAG: polyprenyl synthetase family protein [Bacteroidaceae bacterium]|nr:polyprenyl synthetase family protein [Bacteroidaceae bacterium]